MKLGTKLFSYKRDGKVYYDHSQEYKYEIIETEVVGLNTRVRKDKTETRPVINYIEEEELYPIFENNKEGIKVQAKRWDGGPNFTWWERKKDLQKFIAKMQIAEIQSNIEYILHRIKQYEKIKKDLDINLKWANEGFTPKATPINYQVVGFGPYDRILHYKILHRLENGYLELECLDCHHPEDCRILVRPEKNSEGYLCSS